MNCARSVLFSLAACALFASAGEATPIQYTLPAKARVSLAIYDQHGRMIRTLLNAQMQEPGPQSIPWDGLTADGAPAAPGRYEWRTLQSQGLTSQYLLSLGTDTGHDHWIAQHGGPSSVSVDEQGLVVGGSPEGSPLLAKVTFDGRYLWNNGGYRAADGSIDSTIMDGKVFALQNGGYIYVLDAATGQAIKSGTARQTYNVWLPYKKLPPIPDSDETVVTEHTVPNGHYLLRISAKMGSIQAPLWSIAQDRSFQLEGLKANGTLDMIAVPVWGNPHPVEVKNGKLRLSFGYLDAQGNMEPPPKKSSGDELADLIDNVEKTKVRSERNFAIPSVELLVPASRVDARAGSLVAAFPAAGAIAWIDPETGKILQRAEVPNVSDVTVLDADTVLASAGAKLFHVQRSGAVAALEAADLNNASRISCDPQNRLIWVYDEGKGRQQILKFTLKADGKSVELAATFGREGGRRTGLFKAEDFNAVSDLASDLRGGFIITEWMSAPRRTAHFDGSGKLLKQWNGGQQFYTFAAPEPDNPSRVWMDSQWGWLMQVDVDYEKRSWSVRACYPWAQNLNPFWSSTGKMASRMYPIKREVNGKTETLLWFENSTGLLLKVDEEKGQLVPVAMLGNNQGQSLDKKPVEALPAAWADALELVQPGLSKKPERRNYTGYAWADSRGDGKMHGDELTLLNPKVYGNGHGFGGGGGARAIDAQFNLYADCNYGKFRGAWVKFPAHGISKQGWPLWDWNRAIAGPPDPLGGTCSMFALPTGDVLSLHLGVGDGYKALDTYGSGHGTQWPANQTDGARLCRWDAQGNKVWQVGTKAARNPAPAGQLHYPIRISGELPGYIGVCDKIVRPCEIWSEDGLYVGGLLDARTEDGLPLRLYRWWTGGRDDFHPETGRAAFQYDMCVGGSLAKLPNGDAVFMGAGWNNVPVFKLTGFHNIERQKGALEIKATGETAQANGTGLRANYFENNTLDGEPALKRIDSRVWFERARQGFAWRLPFAVKAYSARWIGHALPKFSEAYTFAVYTKGGVRLWINDDLVLDQWNASGKFFTKPIALEAGKRCAIKLEWHAGKEADPELHLCWESTSLSIEHIPQDRLFPDAVLTQ